MRLVRIEQAPSANEPRRPDGLPAWMGSMKDEIWIGPDFDAADEEIARAFEESEIFPPDESGEDAS